MRDGAGWPRRFCPKIFEGNQTRRSRTGAGDHVRTTTENPHSSNRFFIAADTTPPMVSGMPQWPGDGHG